MLSILKEEVSKEDQFDAKEEESWVDTDVVKDVQDDMHQTSDEIL